MSRLAIVAAALVLAACGTVPLAPATPDLHAGASVPGFSFERDTFAFPNEIRARHPNTPDLYANYCFVLARSLRQFWNDARFDPAAPRVSPEEYERRVRAIVSRPVWDPPLPPDDRVVIPGYADLRDFSRGQEAAVKEGMGGRFWTLVHWTNWRVTFPVTDGEQASVAQEIVDELDAGRLVQLLVTNWPKIELNHGVVAYAYHETPRGLEFTVWDPNDPAHPGTMLFDRSRRQFWATALYDTEPGPIRAFRMYYAWWL